MKTLIVLCAGGSKVNDKPIYLNYHPDGQLIAKKALCGIFCESYDRVVFTILQEEAEKYQAESILIEAFNDKIEIVKLPKLTEGPADSVYQTIKIADIKGAIAIRDSLGSMELHENLEGNFIVGLNLLTYNDSIQRIKSKGFIVANEQNIVLDFMEKRFCSDIVSAGLYGFKHSEEFVSSFIRLNDPAYNIPRISVGHVMEHLIGYRGKKFKLGFTDAFEDWGDQIAWIAMQRKRSTVFIDIDSFIGGRKFDSINEDLLKKMRIVTNNGMKIILYYSLTPHDKVQEIINFLDKEDIKYIAVIDRKGSSSEKYFVNTVEDFEKISLGL